MRDPAHERTKGRRTEPAHNASRTAYDSWHLGQDDEIDAESPWSQWVRQHLDTARDLSHRAILEIGCGKGGLACWLATQQPIASSIVAADFSPMAVQLAREHAESVGISWVQWEVADIQRLPYSDGDFDTVISCETIEHVPDPLQAVQELARVLKPGGRLFLTTPNYVGVMGLYRAYRRLLGRPFTEVGQPINNLTSIPRTYSWLRRAKLAVDLIDGKGHFVPRRGARPFNLHWLDSAGRLTRWVALQSMFIARKT